MEKLINKVDSVLAGFLMILMILMVLDVSWQVITRYLAPKPSAFTEELASYFLMWIGVLGGAYAYRHKAHLGIDILTLRFTGKTRIYMDMFIYLMVILFAVLALIWGGLRLVFIQLYLNQLSAALRIPVGYVYLVLPLTGFLLVLYSIYFIIRSKSDNLVISETEKQTLAGMD